jgi:hypothetical protein
LSQSVGIFQNSWQTPHKCYQREIGWRNPRRIRSHFWDLDAGLPLCGKVVGALLANRDPSEPILSIPCDGSRIVLSAETAFYLSFVVAFKAKNREIGPNVVRWIFINMVNLNMFSFLLADATSVIMLEQHLSGRVAGDRDSILSHCGFPSEASGEHSP